MRQPAYAVFADHPGGFGSWIGAALARAGLMPIHVICPSHLRIADSLTIHIDRDCGHEALLSLPTGRIVNLFQFTAALNYLSEPVQIDVSDVHAEDAGYVLEEVRSILTSISLYSSGTILNRAPTGHLSLMSSLTSSGGALTFPLMERSMSEANRRVASFLRVENRYYIAETESPPGLADYSKQLLASLPADIIEIEWAPELTTRNLTGKISVTPDLRQYPFSVIEHIASLLLSHDQ